MGILGLGDHVAALRPEDINGHKKTSSKVGSTAKAQAWGHLLVAAATLVRGSSADCVVLKKVRVPECSSCRSNSKEGCADIAYYSHPKLSNGQKPVTDDQDRAFLSVHQNEVDRDYVCRSLVASKPVIHADKGIVSRELQLDLDSCYERENFDFYIDNGMYTLQERPLKEYIEKAKAAVHDAVEPDFTYSRGITENMAFGRSSKTVVLPTPTATFACPSGSTLSCSFVPTPPPAIQ